MINGSDYWDDLLEQPLVNKRFEGKSYNTFKNLNTSMYDVIKKQNEIIPNKTVIIDSDEKKYTFKDLLVQADRLADYLFNDLKLRAGQRVGTLLYNSIEFVCLFLAIQKIGAILVPMPTKYRKREIESLLSASQCSLLIAEEKYEPFIEEMKDKNILCILTEEVRTSMLKKHEFSNKNDSDDVIENKDIEKTALLMFTSGTTSESKAAVIKNYHIQHAINSYESILALTQEDSTILAIPGYNVTGLIATICLFLKTGGLMKIHRIFDIHLLLEEIKKERITFLHASPTIFTLMLQESDSISELPSLKTLVCGSSNMPITKIKKLKKWLPQVSFRTVYGLSETTSPATIFPKDASESEYIGSSGRAIPGLEIKIINDEGGEAEKEAKGEIYVRGTNVINQYDKNSTDLITEDNWLKTGDIGYLNKDDYLYVVDRKKDFINRGGEKIYCFELENILHDVEGVDEATVVGKEDNKYGEVPIALVKLWPNTQLDADELKKMLASQLANYKVPKSIYFVNHIPKTANGKVDKKEIKKDISFKKGESNF